MGFTPLPTQPGIDGWNQAYAAIRDYSDLSAIFFQDAIPWQQAYRTSNYAEYPAELVELLTFLRSQQQGLPSTHQTLVAFNPLRTTYVELAGQFGSRTSPLPFPWNIYDFDHPRVQTAALNYCRALISLFQPKYLITGVEPNIMLARAPHKWEPYKRLQKFLYENLKNEMPSLSVGVSIQYEHLLGYHVESRAFENSNPGVLWQETKNLLQFSDLVPLSTYPYMNPEIPIGADYYDRGLQLGSDLKKQMAVEQTGYLTKVVSMEAPFAPGFQVTLNGSDAAQQSFMNFILTLAYVNNFAYLINFVPIDYGTVFGTSPSSLAWAYSGLWNQDLTPKPALTTWEAFRSLAWSGGTA